MNKTDLIQKIKQLEGISQDERSYLINIVNTKKKYGLVWEDKPEDVEEQLRTHLPVLREVVEKRILSVQQTKMSEPGFIGLKDGQDSKKSKTLRTSLFDELEEQDNPENQINPESHSSDNFEAPNHILIEGDNLHTLTALTFTHQGKIDVIYIDPPYNTGNNSWRYNNDYIEKDDPFKHSKWLSMMEKRLKIAKKLLKSDGSLIVAIDDYELNTLGLLLDDIFYNYERDLIIVEHHPQGAGSNTVSRTHEYAYFLTPIGIGFKGRKQRDEDNKWSLKRSGQGENNWRMNRPKQFFALIVDSANHKVIDVGPELQRDDTNYQTGSSREGYLRIYPIDRDGKERCWRYNRSTMQKLIKQDKIEYTTKGSLVVKKHSVNAVPVFSVWSDKRYNAGTSGSVLLTDIMGKANTFPYPKSLYTVYDMVELIIGNNSEAVVLDFFAGSGTTLHAIMQLNEEDDGHRICILSTNNENNICEEVTYERNRRVIQGYTNTKGEWVSGLTNNNLRYYKSEFVPSMKDEPNKRLLTQTSTDLLCIKEDCYTDITDSVGFNPTQCRIFTNDGGKYLMVVYHSRKQLEVYEQLIAYIKSINDLSETIKLYAFSPEKETLLEDFAEVADKIDAVPLPEAIYNAYRATFRTLKLDKKPPAPPVETTNALSLNVVSDDNELNDLSQDQE